MSFLDQFVRNETTTIIIDDAFVATDTFVRVRVAQRWLNSIFLVILAVVWVVLLTAYRRPDIVGPQKNMMRVLLGFTAFLTTCTISTLVMACVYFDKSDWRTCANLAAIPTVFYISSQGFAYAILLRRARVSSGVEGKFLHAMRYIARMSIMSTPGVAIAMAISTRGVLLPNGVCVQTLPWVLGLVSMMANFVISCAFLSLFVIPVLKHTRKDISSSESTKKMARTLKKHFFYSSFGIVTSSAFLGSVAVLQMYSRLHGVGADYHLLLLDFAMGPCDAFCNLISILGVTTAVWRRPAPRLSVVRSPKLSQAKKRSSHTVQSL